jgi:hypothetical protein
MPKGPKPVLIQLASSVIRWALDAFVMASLILAVKEQLNTIVSKAIDTMKAAVKYLWRYMLTTLLFSVITMGIILLVVILMSIVFASFAKMPDITIIMLLATIAIIACVTATVYCTIRLSLAGVVCIMEETGPVKSLKTSHSLIKKSVSPVVGVFCFILLLFALLFVPGFLFGSVIVPKSAGEISLVVYQVLAGVLAVPVWVSVMVVLYKKLKEAVN